MGKAVLLLFTAIVVSTTFVGLNQSALRQMTDATHSIPQAQSFARNYAETARSAVISSMEGLNSFRDRDAVAADIGMNGGRAVSYGGGHYALTDYLLTPESDTVSFTVTGQAYHTRQQAADGEVGWSFQRHSIRSLFALDAPNLPCLPIAGAHMEMNLDSDANIDCPGRDKAPLLNAARYLDYKVDDAFGPIQLVLASYVNEVDGTEGSKGDGIVATADTSFSAPRGVPLGENIYIKAEERVCNAALSITTPKDTNITTSGDRDYGYNSSTPRTVRIRGDLTIRNGDRFRGNGLLLVEGDLTVRGRLQWKGIVYVLSGNDLMKVDFEDARQVDIDGSLLIDHDAPPAGGHMDLTTVRRLDGVWSSPASDSTISGMDIGREWGDSRPWMNHRHRYSNDFSAGNNGTALVIFRDAGDEYSDHEVFTHFDDTLDLLDTTRVYFEIQNFENTGGGRIGAILNGAKCLGSVRTGFSDACASSENPHRTRPFRANQVDSLGFTVRSLRLLSRHQDMEPLNDPTGEVSAGCTVPYPDAPVMLLRAHASGGCTSESRPRVVAGLHNRDGALRIQVRRAHDEALLYEAMPYWHSKPVYDSEYLQEEQEQLDWLAELAAGGTYGLEFDANEDLNLTMDADLVAETLECLDLGDNVLTHLSTVSYAEVPHTESEQECEDYDNGIGNGLDCAPGNSGNTPGGAGDTPGNGGGPAAPATPGGP